MNLLRTPFSFCAALLLVGCQFLCSAQAIYSQPSDTIVANPKAVTLRHIWKVTGVNSGDEVGGSVGALPDFNNDTLSEFALYTSGVWSVFYGSTTALSTQPAWVFEYGAGGISGPVPGRFRGDDSLSVGFLSYRWVDSGHSTDYYLQLRLFDVENDSLHTSPSMTWDPGKTMDSLWFIFPNDFIGVNLDKTAGDELVMITGVTVRNHVRSQVGEIWLYAGGPEFQVDTPTLVIRDQETNLLESSYYLYTDDFDNDGYMDMALAGGYAPDKLKFWYGGEGSPWNWTDTPDRVLVLDGTGLNLRLTLGDLDGDGVKDLAGTVYAGHGVDPGIYVYLSGKGKDFRSRSFSYVDADVVLRINTSQYRVLGSSGGYLNDSLRRYATLPLIFPGFDQFDDSEMLLLSGGKNGPNGTFDARYRPELDGVTPGRVFRQMTPLPDCNGDGYDDFLTGSYDWYGFNHGIAMVLAGGPEIPNDDPTVSVREEPIAGELGGLYLWPNPVQEELNIAWKGNLRKMPERFTVHDMSGKLIASGKIEPYLGAALWKCGDLPSGTYLLTAFDRDGEVIASTRVVKEE